MVSSKGFAESAQTLLTRFDEARACPGVAEKVTGLAGILRQADELEAEVLAEIEDAGKNARESTFPANKVFVGLPAAVLALLFVSGLRYGAAVTRNGGIMPDPEAYSLYMWSTGLPMFLTAAAIPLLGRIGRIADAMHGECGGLPKEDYILLEKTAETALDVAEDSYSLLKKIAKDPTKISPESFRAAFDKAANDNKDAYIKFVDHDSGKVRFARAPDYFGSLYTRLEPFMPKVA